MRIAVDARPLAHPFTGIGRYTESLLKRLVQVGHEWFLYADRPLTLRFPLGRNARLRTGRADGVVGGGLVYSQAAFVRWSRRARIDVFWSPRHHLPLMLPDRIATVVTVHDMVSVRYPETMRTRNRLLERTLMGPSLRQATRIICVSDFTASEVAELMPWAAGKCVVIPEAAEPSAGGARGASDAGASDDLARPVRNQPYLLFVGTLEPRKNLVTLLRAFAKACEHERFRHRLVVVGGYGWGPQNLNAEIARLGLADRVVLEGNVNDVELHDLYVGSTALAIPSLYEGFGLPALEAMQRGVPVIAGARGALPEVVQDGGILVDPLDVRALADAMLRVSTSSGLHRRLSAAALARAASFSWDRAADQTLAVLETAAKMAA